MNYEWRFETLYSRQESRPSPRYTHLNAEFQRIAKRDKKASLSDQCKEIEENNRMGKTRDLKISQKEKHQYSILIYGI